MFDDTFTPSPLNSGLFRVLCIIALVETAALAIAILVSGRTFVPLTLLGLALGLSVEFKRLTGSWAILAWTLVMAYAGSFLIYLVKFSETGLSLQELILKQHIAFCVIVIVVALIKNPKGATTPLNSTVTLLQSACVTYLFLESPAWPLHDGFMKLLAYIGFAAVFFTLLQAFVASRLLRPVRFLLSLWSTFLMFVFAIINLVGLLEGPDMGMAGTAASRLLETLDYFLFGISAIYIGQNLMMAVQLFPTEDVPFTESLREAYNDHVARYYDARPHRLFLLLLLAACIALFRLNHHYGFLPPITLVWLFFGAYSSILLAAEHYRERMESAKPDIKK